MAYDAKTNWQNNEIVEASDMNRIEQGISDADVGLGNVQEEVTTHKADNMAHGVDTKIPKTLATAADQFLISSGVSSWVIKTVEQIKTLLGLESAAYTESSDYATAAQGTKADNALPSSEYTANDVLDKLKTVDGSGSGLDADKLDGKHASDFATADAIDRVLARQQRQDIDIFKYGAIGDGDSHPLSEQFETLEQAQGKYPFATSLTDEIDYCAIQLAINTELEQYSTNGAYHFYIHQSHPEFFIPKGVYLINRTIDLTFRNDLVINGTGILKWTGENDGLMIEMKCSARLIIKKLHLDLNHKAGSGTHWSGNGTSDGDPTKDRLAGKGNVSIGRFYNVYMENQLSTTEKTAFDTFPYPEDTDYPYYYSADDSEWYSPNFRWGAGTGFAISVGASTTDIYDGHFTVANPIKLFGGSITMYSPTFTIMGGNKGCIFVTKNATVSQIDVYSAYYEGSSKPFIEMDETSTTGNIKGIKVIGGTYSQVGEPENFISIPSMVPACITIIDPHIINPTIGGIDASNATLKLMKSGISTTYADYQFPSYNVKNMSGEFTGYTGTYRWDKFMNRALTVNSAAESNPVTGTFKTLDEALLYSSNSYNGYVEIILVTDAEITAQVYINTPRLKIYSLTSKTLTLSAVVNVTGYVELSSVALQQTIDKPIVMWGGTARLNTCTVNASSGQSIIDGKNGEIVVNNCTHNTGSIIDATDSLNVVQGTLRNNTYSSSETVVKTNDLSKEIYVESASISPSGGVWAKGTKSRNLTAGTGEPYETICVAGGSPGVWKVYATVAT